MDKEADMGIWSRLNPLKRWKPVVARDAVFDGIKTGDLWNKNANYINDWFAVERIDDQTIIIGEPKSSQYNISYLIIGKKRAIVYDTGSGEGGAGTPRISAVIKKYTDKPIQVILSHFHFDHTGGVAQFDGVMMIDLPRIRARFNGRAYRVSILENAGIQRPLLKVTDWTKPGESIDLGNRKIQVVSTPGHTPESVSLIDCQRRYAFTGDLVYQHLGGIVAFVPGSDLQQYSESVAQLATATGDDYRYFGGHGLPEYDHNWLSAVGETFQRIRKKDDKGTLSASTLAPLVPLRLHARDQLLIYLLPFLDPSRVFSRQFSICLVLCILSGLLLFWKALA